MKQPKRRPTLDELKSMPLGLLRLEVAQLCADAALAEQQEILTEAETLLLNAEPEPEAIMELWNRLRASSSTS